MGLEEKTEKLLERLKSLGSAVIGYSGGVDSAVLCMAAFRALGSDRMLACLADGPSLPASEKISALEVANQAGFPVRTYSGTEMENPAYVKNGSDRCFHCKGDLFFHLRRIASEKGFEHCLYGANADDLSDFRPGHRAAGENGVWAPLAEAGLNKGDIRNLARKWNLSCHDKPANPCLSSRIPYGEEVLPERLKQIEAAEDILREKGFREFRVRWNFGAAQLEVGRDELFRLSDQNLREELIRRLTLLGFTRVTVDPEGFQSGKLNHALSPAEKQLAMTASLLLSPP